MRTIRFRDGYIKIPQDFIELSLVVPKHATIPIVMTVKNEALYGTPRFVFFANSYPCNFNQDIINALYNQAEAYYPEFSKLDSKRITAEVHIDAQGQLYHVFYDTEGNPRTFEEWKHSPAIGIFPAEQRTNDSDQTLPFGIEIKYKYGRDPRKNLKLWDR